MISVQYEIYQQRHSERLGAASRRTWQLEDTVSRYFFLRMKKKKNIETVSIPVFSFSLSVIHPSPNSLHP